MGLQSEITVEVLAPIDEIYRILQQKGFFFKEQFKMIDYYFTGIECNAATTYRELISNSFLLRDIVLKRRYVAGEKSMLIHKHKKLDRDGNVIGEEKFQCEIGDTLAAIDVFKQSGLNNWCVKSITGHVFKHNKTQIELLIQEIDGLGFFMEIEEFEGQRGTNLQRIAELKKFAKSLGLPLGKDMHCKINFLLFLKSRRGKSSSRIYFGAP